MKTTSISVRVDRRVPDPRLSHAWRWGRATELFHLGIPPGHGDDTAVFAALNYLREISVADSQKQIKEVRERHPLLTVAHGVFRDAGVVRTQIELLLAAGFGVTIIAEATGLSMEVVIAYEVLFFSPGTPDRPEEIPHPAERSDCLWTITSQKTAARRWWWWQL